MEASFTIASQWAHCVLRSRAAIFIMLAIVAAVSAFGAAIPDELLSVTSQIEKCIATADQPTSRQYVHYECLYRNWEIRWWSLLGRSEIPSEEFIKQHPDLWNAATVVKLSLEGYCKDIGGVRRLLHGGMPPAQMKARKEFADVQSVKSTAARIEVATVGDDGRPVVAVFEKIEDRWMLTDVILQMK